MAVSLALNWSPPPSSPLFEEGTSPAGRMPGNESQSSFVGTSSPQPSASTATTAMSNGFMSTSSASNGENLNAAGYNAHGGSSSSTGSTRSYAAAASTQQLGPNTASYQMPSYPGPAVTSSQSFSGVPALSVFRNKSSISTSLLTDMQTALSDARSPAVMEDGSRRRTASGPQKPTHLAYDDMLQHYPHNVAHPASTWSGSSGNAMGASAHASPLHSPPSGSANSGGLSTGANGYHPYRRTPKGSDAMSPSYYNGQAGPPMLPPLPGQPPLAAHSMLPQTQRIRSTSTTSSGAARDTSRVVLASTAPASSGVPGSYSEAVAGMARTAPSVHQVGLGHLRNSPQLRPTMPATSQRSDSATRADSVASDRSNRSSPSNAPPLPAKVSPASYHTRTDSNSSVNSATDRSLAMSTSSNSSFRGSSVAGSTGPQMNKKSSPLSRAGIANDDKDAVYAGSDDEDTIRGRSTPTPGDKPKKGLSNKLKKALSFSTLNDIQQAEAAAAAPDRAYGGRNNMAYKRAEGHSSGETNGSSGSTRSTSPPRTPDNGAPPILGSSAASISSRRSTRPPLSGSDGTSKRSLFNRKFNSSTDNISISSTVSSASVMLRKVGNLGKMARRSSLMGLTNMFNKDKDSATGREGLQGDNFGVPIPPTAIIASDDALGTKGKKDKVKAKKGNPAMASVSHATVELESNGASADPSMTPAASYVRQHQLQMRQQAENDRIAREREEAERLALRNNSKTTDDVTESRQKMIEKEKERLKSKRGWKKRFGVGSIGSSSDAKQVTGLETMPAEQQMNEPDVHVPGYGATGGMSVGSNVGQLGGNVPYQDSSLDSAYEDGELEPPHMPGAAEGYESSDDFETDSLRHWGEGIERSRESAAKIKSVRGILKNTSTFERSSQRSSPPVSASGSFDKPFAGRIRANSYDAPAAGHSTGPVPLMSQISTTPAATDRVDGVPRASLSQDDDSKGRSGTQDRVPVSGSSSTASSSFGHHANSSMPTLSLMMKPSSASGQRSVTTSTGERKRLVFAEAHIYHSTWPAHVYDRRGELATCNRLTPLLAQRIKEELNTYKMEEMAVAPSSRIHTHFFV